MRIGALGDVLLTRRTTYSLFLAGFRSSLVAPLRHATLLKADPWIEDVLDSESPHFATAFAGAWPGVGGEFDIAIVISQSDDLIRSASIAARDVLRVSPSPERADVSIALQWAEAARGFCLPFGGEMPTLPVTGEALSSGAVLIHPGSGSSTKNWPIERFAELGRRLQVLGHQVTWIWGPAEADLSTVPTVGSSLEQPTLRDLAATLATARLCIGNDSGVSHLAGAVGAPTLALFGATNPVLWRPDGPRVHVVRSGSALMTDISLDAVFAEATRLLDSSQQREPSTG